MSSASGTGWAQATSPLPLSSAELRKIRADLWLWIPRSHSSRIHNDSPVVANSCM